MSQCQFRRTPASMSSRRLALVWCPRYRYLHVDGRVSAGYGELVTTIAEERGCQIVAKDLMAGRDCLALVGAIDAPASVVRAFNCRTERMLREDFEYLRKRAKVLWSPSYLAGSVSEWTLRVRIEHLPSPVSMS